MSNAAGSSCHTRSRWGRSLEEIYNALPREIRDRIKITKSNVCAGCIRAKLRRNGLEHTLKRLDEARRCEREKVAARSGGAWSRI